MNVTVEEEIPEVNPITDEMIKKAESLHKPTKEIVCLKKEVFKSFVLFDDVKKVFTYIYYFICGERSIGFIKDGVYYIDNVDKWITYGKNEDTVLKAVAARSDIIIKFYNLKQLCKAYFNHYTRRTK